MPKAVYKKIKFKIHKVEDADATNAALTDMKGKSVVLEGTVDGNAFTWVSTLDEEQERKGTFDIGGNDNLTFNFNPSGWFTKSGARLDPRGCGCPWTSERASPGSASSSLSDMRRRISKARRRSLSSAGSRYRMTATSWQLVGHFLRERT